MSLAAVASGGVVAVQKSGRYALSADADADRQGLRDRHGLDVAVVDDDVVVLMLGLVRILRALSSPGSGGAGIRTSCSGEAQRHICRLLTIAMAGAR